jgi:hypothetical protein
LKSQHQAKRGLPVYKNGIDENMTFFSLKSGWPDEFEKMTPKMLPKPSFVKIKMYTSFASEKNISKS